MASHVKLTPEGKRFAGGSLTPSPDCRRCSHMAVCQLFKAAVPMIGQQFSQGNEPFKAHDLAKICRYYELPQEPSEQEAEEEA